MKLVLLFLYKLCKAPLFRVHKCIPTFVHGRSQYANYSALPICIMGPFRFSTIFTRLSRRRGSDGRCVSSILGCQGKVLGLESAEGGSDHSFVVVVRCYDGESIRFFVLDLSDRHQGSCKYRFEDSSTWDTKARAWESIGRCRRVTGNTRNDFLIKYCHLTHFLRQD